MSGLNICAHWARRLVLAVGALGLISASSPAPDYGMRSLPTDRLLKPEGAVTNLVVLLSDADGWSADEEKVSSALRAEGSLVIGVDLPAYYEALRRETRDCLYLVSDIEKLSKELHRSQRLATYRPPILAGLGEGATLALAITAQTPVTTITETVAVDPGSIVPLQKLLCTPAPKSAVADGVIYGLTKGALPQPVSITYGPDASADGQAHGDELKATHPDIAINRGTGDRSDMLLQAIREAESRNAPAKADLDLPIVILDAKPAHDTMAVIYSGDGGWRDIDRKLAAYFQEAGMPVVGVDALRYFWSEKTPAETANDLSKIMATYQERWHVKNVVLVGYSFGANILPATYLQLPQRDRDAVPMMSLLALSHAADFEIAVTGWLGVAGAGRHGDPVDALATIAPEKIQCIQGQDDEERACPALESLVAKGAQIVTRSGGHHFDGNYRALSDIILERLTALRAGGSSGS